MARPRKNNLDYFPHDNSMRNDRKIKALRTKFGNNGYAIYNMLLEILSEADLLILKWDETEIELVSGDLNIVSDELTLVSDYLFHIKLLKQINGYVFCPQLDARAKMVFGKRTHDLNSLRSENGINVTETRVSGSESTQRIVKKSKEKNSKEIYKEKKININNIILEKKQKEFQKEIEQFMNKYPKEMLKAFFAYWSEQDKKGNMKKELQKTWDTKRRLVTWQNNEKNWRK